MSTVEWWHAPATFGDAVRLARDRYRVDRVGSGPASTAVLMDVAHVARTDE
ncbi:hypothetical protein GCM10010399_82830 [Dactylosporangium fulvum]|uniref:Uncharacterized protein n=1 Tax=Dactylosporangium fulvum TaxID=53359 RepID=A0ABY5VU21_9ACTN|nr:hypothetical protein [Dactylosporangium fulvum]UWP79286.1 hypothetical protein Dfulv_29465 [Dactylosporangium fulvum]